MSRTKKCLHIALKTSLRVNSFIDVPCIYVQHIIGSMPSSCTASCRIRSSRRRAVVIWTRALLKAAKITEKPHTLYGPYRRRAHEDISLQRGQFLKLCRRSRHPYPLTDMLLSLRKQCVMASCLDYPWSRECNMLPQICITMLTKTFSSRVTLTDYRGNIILDTLVRPT